MAQAAVQFDKQAFSCSICLDFLKDPATLPCGHNYCRSCIQSYWDGQKQSSCPQCRQRFSPRPVLVTNTMLAELVEQLQRIELQQSLKGFMLKSDASSKKTETRRWILRTIQDKETALQKLQQEALSFRRSADEAVKSSDQSFNSVVQVLEEVHSEVTRQIKELQEKEEAKLKQLHDHLQRDITLLRMTVSELDSLTPGQALQRCPPLSALEPPRTYSLSMGSLEQAASAVTALTDLLKVTLKNISKGFRPDQQPSLRPEAALSLPEPETREEFINYAREIVLDPNTAHQKLKLSRGNRRVTKDLSRRGDYLDHPDRFSHFIQVLSTEGLTGRCYWEVEWEDFDIIAVSYKNIKRKGDSEKCEFGFNDNSWALRGRSGKIHRGSFWHHRVETKISGPVSGRIGVYLDHSAGVLAFYSICDSKIHHLIHRVQTTFTQPLYAGVRFFNTSQSVTAYFHKLKQAQHS